MECSERESDKKKQRQREKRKEKRETVTAERKEGKTNLKKDRNRRTEKREPEKGRKPAGHSGGLLSGDDGGIKQVRESQCLLPFDGSGKIPWLRLLLTDDFGESWFSWEEDPAVFGEECCEEGLDVCCLP